MGKPAWAPDGAEVLVGSVWFVWGDHHRIVAERFTDGQRHVLAIPERIAGPGKNGYRKGWPWTEDWRVAHHGAPSVHYEGGVT